MAPRTKMYISFLCRLCPLREDKLLQVFLTAMGFIGLQFY